MTRDREGQLPDGACGEWQVERKQLKENASHRPHVRSAVVADASHRLGAHVVGCPHVGHGEDCVWRERSRDAKVAQNSLRATRPANEKDVGRFDIAMDNPILMQVSER